MTKQENDQPSRHTIKNLLAIIASGSEIVAIRNLPGSFSNSTHLIEAQKSDGSSFEFIIRRYAVFGNYDRGEKAVREYKTYKLLAKHDVPVPEPLYLDQSGVLLGSPGIVTSFVPGEFVQELREPIEQAKALAKTLAKIHLVECDESENKYLLDANREATWFVRMETIPDYVKAYHQGEAVWQKVKEKFRKIEQKKEALVHLDYWPGNVLWDGNEITAVIDWEEAAYGDSIIDVAYCRMNLILDGLYQAADEFIDIYERETGRKITNRSFWELAAAVRPMIDLEGWGITTPVKRERFENFIINALEELDQI